MRIRLQASKAVSGSTRQFPEVSVKRAPPPLPSWLAARKAFSRGKQMFEHMGTRIVHCGDAGTGQAAKISIT